MKKSLILILITVASLQASEPASSVPASQSNRSSRSRGFGGWRMLSPEQKTTRKAERVARWQSEGLSEADITSRQQKWADKRAQWKNLTPEERTAKWTSRREKWQSATPEEREARKAARKEKMKSLGYTSDQISDFRNQRAARRAQRNEAGTLSELGNIDLND